MLSVILSLSKKQSLPVSFSTLPSFQNLNIESCVAVLKLNLVLGVVVCLPEGAGAFSLSGAEDTFTLW